MQAGSPVLAAILNNVRDFHIARDLYWYRISVKSAPRLTHPRILAFYQTKIFDADRWSIRWYAEVRRLRVSAVNLTLPIFSYRVAAG